MKKRLLVAGVVAAAASLILPGAAFAQQGSTPILDTPDASINAMWVVIAAVLVMFMQAGFLLLEVGFSRAKNVGAGVAKILVNFSIASLCYWAVGFALAFGGLGAIAGTDGFFLDVGSSIEQAGSSIPFVEAYSISPAAFMFFQFVFCAVSLAIVWGTTIERIKFGAYVIYAIIFSSADLPDHQPLDLRRRLAPGQHRHAGLRRLDRCPPDRRDRCAGGAAAARPEGGQVRGRRQRRGRSRGTRCRWSASAC